MRPRTWVRIAAALTAVHFVAHTLGTINTDTSTPGANVLMAAMRNFHFNVMGTDRTAWDFFHGLGLLFSANLAILTVLTWQIAGLIETDPRGGRPILVTLAAANALILVLSCVYFFLAPIALSALAFICLAAATWVP